MKSIISLYKEIDDNVFKIPHIILPGQCKYICVIYMQISTYVDITSAQETIYLSSKSPHLKRKSTGAIWCKIEH
jgi:hypothetical protein